LKYGIVEGRKTIPSLFVFDMSLHLKLDQFEGPLELLLSLIEERKLDITRVHLAEVADQYLALLAEGKGISLENLAWFLVIAARLVLLKSKMLLPSLDFTEEEEAAIDDLEERLREYKRFKEISLTVEKRLLSPERSFVREKFHGVAPVFVPVTGVTVSILRAAFESILGEIPSKEKIAEAAIEEIVSLEEHISRIERSIVERAEYSFREALRETKNRMEVIVSFLAVLELVKQRVVSVEQGNLFGDIRMLSTGLKRESVF
jgi:segregation and condensation protein A